MPIRSRKNEYRGLNAHLQSYLLHEPGGWHSFHGDHITDLARLLDDQLPEGYYTRAEKSLQISGSDLLSEDLELSRMIPDVTVYEDRPRAGMASPAAVTTSPVTTMPLEDTLVLVEEEINSVVIYRMTEELEVDYPVTRIELLSASNKPPGPACEHYLGKRWQTLQSGVRLVELDYLHESRSPIPKLPSYPDGDPRAYPYLILISDPRPSFREGRMDVYGFHADEPVPIVNIPLSGNDVLPFDFGEAYNYTLSRTRFYTTRAIDYEQLPEHFDAYRTEDQERIKAVMARVKEAVEAA
jgi:hypothetical protein